MLLRACAVRVRELGYFGEGSDQNWCDFVTVPRCQVSVVGSDVQPSDVRDVPICVRHMCAGNTVSWYQMFELHLGRL